MFVKGIIPTALESIKWQDYRGTKTGMVVYYNTDPVSEIPIREVPDELPTEILPDPNYETATFGLYGCKHAKMRSSLAKKKVLYLFFMTRYAGTNIDKAEELIVTGLYHIKQTADVQKLHIRYLKEYTCLNEDSCLAFRADKVHFVSIEDAFMITPEVLENWGCSSRITRQSKIFLDEEKTAELIAYLESKQNVVDMYSEETERLEPAYDEEEDEEEEDIEDLLEDAEDYEEDEDEEEAVSETEPEPVSEVVVTTPGSEIYTETVEVVVGESLTEAEENTVEEPVQSVIEQADEDQGSEPEQDTSAAATDETAGETIEEPVDTGFSEMPTQVIDPDTQTPSPEEAEEQVVEDAKEEDTEEEDNPYNLDMSKYEQ